GLDNVTPATRRTGHVRDGSRRDRPLGFAPPDVRPRERTVEGGEMQYQLRMRVALVLCGLALLTIPLGSFLASAHTQTYSANLSLHFDKKTQTFDGHVGTSSFCHEDRLVSLYK